MKTLEPRARNSRDASRGNELANAAGSEESTEISKTSKTSKAIELLEEGITQIADSESFKEYLAFTRSFREYSPNNTMLVFLQRSDATMVAGYKRWKAALGRQVRKGEKAIKILAPIVRKETDAGTGEEVSRVVGFRDANVFALEQTESVDGSPPPSPPQTGAVNGGSGERARELYSFLSGICAAEGVPVKEKELGPGHYGYHDPVGGGIVISTGIPQVRKATTLAHEICHYFLHPLRESLKLDTATKETEAEGASYAICSEFGIDTSAFSFPYVARHAKDPQLLRGVLGRIQKVAAHVLLYTEATEAAQDEEEGKQAA